MEQASGGKLALVTGGTGFLGSHIAERLARRGDRVRALVRPASDTRFLLALGAELIVGDLVDRSSCREAARGVDEVYHCAAKVGDWGPWSEFQSGCLDATRTLAGAAVDSGVGRFLHISSTSAYGHPQEGGDPIDETAPLGQNLWRFWDDYTRSQVECERILWRLAEDRGLPLTVIRPSWLYGERDRTTIARLVGRLRAGKVPLIGHGDNPISAVYAGNVADAAILAARDPGSVGEAYNITHQGWISQRDYLEEFVRASGAPPVRRRVPYRLAFAVSFALEAIYRTARSRRPPLITRYATWLMGRSLSYSTQKAHDRLGWWPALGYRESIGLSVDWFRAETERRRTESGSKPRRKEESSGSV